MTFKVTYYDDISYTIMPWKRCPCGKHSTFGMPNDKSPSRCGTCRFVGMIDLKTKNKCPCGSRPYFGLVTDVRATCCSKCKTDKMTDIRSKKCSCGKVPSFGIVNGKATCCARCKTHGMIDVVSRKCICGKRPYFGMPGDPRATCCNDCKKENMIDIRSKKCPCGKQPIFGVPGKGGATCCANCKNDDMVELAFRKRCKEEGCSTKVFGEHEFCANHDTERKRLSRVREMKVAKWLREHFAEETPWASWNKQISNWRDCCDKAYRPDFRFDFVTHIVFLEVDEHQHPVERYGCESRRMGETHQSEGGMPTIFIRWCPDAFKVQGTTRRCSEATRKKVLLQEMDRWRVWVPTNGCAAMQIVRLFYDVDKAESPYRQVSRGDIVDGSLVET